MMPPCAAKSPRWRLRRTKKWQAVRALAAVLRAELGAEKVLLFGSRARGDNLLRSDADLLVVSPRFAGVGFSERMVQVLERWSGPVSLEPLCYTPEEFEERRKGINIVAVAAREGRAL